MELKYLALIATENGVLWYNIGTCKKENAYDKAVEFVQDKLYGVASQVKEVIPRIQWMEQYKWRSYGAKGIIEKVEEGEE